MASETYHHSIGLQSSDPPGSSKLRNLFMQAPAAIALLEGPQHIYTFANPLYQKIFDRTEEQLIGKTPRQVFPEINGQGIYEIFDQVFETNQPFTAAEFAATFENSGVAKTGYYNFVIQPIQNEAGAVSDLMVHVYEVTRQAEAHKQIEESEAKYRSLFNSMDQGFCLIEMIFDEAGKPADYRFLEVNPMFASQTGLKDAEGKTARQMVPELEDHWFQVYGDVALTGKSVKFTQGSDAMGRWFEVHAFRIGKEGSKTVAILFTDISEKKIAERVLHENRQLLQAVFDASPNSISVLRPIQNGKGDIHDFQFIMANEFAIQTTGEADIKGKSYAEAFPISRESGVIREMIKVAETGAPAELEKQYERENSPYWLRFIINKVGELLVVTTEDITARREAEEVLRKSERHFRQLTDTVPAIIWITRPDGYCTYLNKNWYDYTGQSEGEAEGFGWLDATHPDDAAEAERRFLEAINKQLPYYILYRLRHKTGEYRWAIDSGQPKFSADGSFEGMIGTVIDVHEQQLAEDKIRESEKRFRSMADASPVMIWTLDEHGNSTYYNTKAAEFTGHTDEDIRQGKTWQVAIHPDDIEFAAGVVGNAITNRIPYHMECRMQRADGEWRWLLNHGTPRFGSEGEYFGFVGSSIDITERKKAETELMQSEARFRNILEQTPEPVLVLKGEDLVLEVANEPLFRAWRMDESVIGKPLLQCLPELQGQGIVELMLDAYHNKKVIKGYDRPVVYDRGDGIQETLYYNFVYSPYVDADGQVTGILIIGTDVTGSVLARQALEESEARFRTLATTIPQIVWTTDEYGQLTYLSNQWETYTGQPVAEGLTQNHLMIHPDDQVNLAAAWRQALQSGAEWKMDYRIKNSISGEYRWFTGLTAPLKDNDGRIFKWIGTATDIHEQKLFTEKLEALVDERTKALQRSNEDLQQFAHVASHDLKEPVRKVKTFVSLLERHLDGVLDERANNFIERIHTAANRMFTMIDGVLRYSTINASVETSEPVNLNEVIKNIETDLELIIQETGTQIHYNELPAIEGAPVLLYQVFYNLVNNSIKFARPGVAPQITITSEMVVHHDQPFVKLLLTDNGIGFEDEQAAAIFDTFTRLNPKDRYEGTGLGLALCKKIAERHGGSISAKGLEHEGATFTILLPVYQGKTRI